MKKIIAVVLSITILLLCGCVSEKEYTISNSQASESTKRLYAFICETYGNAVISGQQESTWIDGEQYEFEYIYEITGEYPAIRGLDYMNDDFEGVNRRAVEWYEKGGIVSICWHCGSDFSGSWTECKETDIADWDKALTEGTDENKMLIAGMDKGAKALKELQEKGIPVLWRPFHELDGDWFWWSRGGAENFKKLWILMYDRYTNYWELDNLIWVLGFSHKNEMYKDFYPGAEYVDIAGADSYEEGAHRDLFKAVKKVVKNEKPICFHECGTIPTVDELKKDGAEWVWFLAWHTEYLVNSNTAESLKEIYKDEYVITLDELPNLKS